MWGVDVNVNYPIRFDANKEISLDKMTPEYLKQSEFILLINFIEDFFNSMYDGDGYYTIEES